MDISDRALTFQKKNKTKKKNRLTHRKWLVGRIGWGSLTAFIVVFGVIVVVVNDAYNVYQSTK